MKPPLFPEAPVTDPKEYPEYAFGCDRDCREFIKARNPGWQKNRATGIHDLKIAITIEASRGAGRARMPILRSLQAKLLRLTQSDLDERIIKYLARKRR